MAAGHYLENVLVGVGAPCAMILHLFELHVLFLLCSNWLNRIPNQLMYGYFAFTWVTFYQRLGPLAWVGSSSSGATNSEFPIPNSEFPTPNSQF